MSSHVALRAAVASLCLLAGAPGLVGTPVPAAAAVRPCSNGLVALTFDDGPSEAVTADLVDVLTERRVPATFFVVGQRVAASPGLVRTASRRGFVIGNHTYRHEMLTRLSDEGVRRTLRKTRRALRDAGVRPSTLMRPPYGAISSRVRSVVADLGLTPVLWDIDPRDWDEGSARAIAERVLGALRPHAQNIVLLHDGVQRSPVTLEAVPAIVRGARDRGYCFAALGPAGRPVPPVPGARVSDADVVEGDAGSTSTLRFTVRLDRPTSRKVSVRVRTADGSATAGADYRAVDQRVEFPVGTTSRQVAVQVRGDRVDETRERLRLLLSEPARLRVQDGVGVGVIRDDDPPPQVRLTDATVTEPAEGTALGHVQVRLDRPSSRRVVLVLATTPLEADETDYVPFEVTRSIAPGELTLDVPVEVLADEVEEGAERFEVRVLSVARATVAEGIGVVTIVPPPSAPAPGDPPS